MDCVVWRLKLEYRLCVMVFMVIVMVFMVIVMVEFVVFVN